MIIISEDYGICIIQTHGEFSNMSHIKILQVEDESDTSKLSCVDLSNFAQWTNYIVIIILYGVLVYMYCLINVWKIIS